MNNNNIMYFFEKEIKPFLGFVDNQSIESLSKVLKFHPPESLYYMLCFELVLHNGTVGMDFFSGASVRNPHGTEILNNLYQKLKNNVNAGVQNWLLPLDTLDYMKNESDDTLIDHIWLEFDTSNSASINHYPSIFWGLPPQIYKDKIKMMQLLELLTNRLKAEIDSKSKNLLSSVFNLTLKTQGITHLGLMTARNGTNLRILINIAAKEDIIAILNHFQKNEISKVTSLINELKSYFDYFSLQLELGGDGTVGAIGLECYHYDRPVKFRKKLSSFTLTKLYEMGYITFATTVDILTFDGCDNITTPFELQLLDKSIYPVTIDRKIHHYKFNILDDNITMKVYLSSECKWEFK